MIPGLSTIGGYSICSTPDDLPSLRLAVKNARHPPTKWCYNDAREGDTVQLRPGGDFGLDLSLAPQETGEERTPFRLKSGTTSVVLIAGGIGINPLFSVLQNFATCLENDTAVAQEVLLIYAASSRAELAFEDEIRDAARAHPSRITVRFIVPDAPEAEEDYTAGDSLTLEQITGALQSRSLSDQESICLLCGPPAMIEAAEFHCIALGIKPNNIHYEKWW